MSETPPPAPPVPPAPPPPPPPPPPTNPARHRRHRRLRRDRTHRVLGGVCAGIARTYGIDVVVVRVLFVIAAIAWIGLPLYLVLWIALPARGDGPDDITEPRDTGMLLALVLIGIGALIFVRHVLPHSWTNGGGFFAPLLLIAAGVAILVLRRPGIERDEPDEHDAYDAYDDSSAADPQPAPTPDPSTAAENAPPTAPADTLDLAPDDDLPPTAWSQTRPWAHWRTTRREYRREWRAQTPRPFLGPLTFSVLLIGAGVASLLEATGAVDVNLAIVLAIGTCIVGAALVVSAWVGRARGLIALGVVLAFAAGVATIVDVPFTGGFGERTYTPLVVRDVQPRYRLGAGTLRLDLSRVDLRAATLDVRAQLGAGEMQVTIPPNVRVDIDAHAGAGEVDVLGHVEHGVDVDTQQHLAGVSGDSALHLILRVGAGHIEVRS